MDTNELTRKANEMHEDLQSQAQDVQEQLREAGEHWRRRATQAIRDASVTADQYVHENAWTTVAMAAVLGCVVGFFLGRSRD